MLVAFAMSKNLLQNSKFPKYLGRGVFFHIRDISDVERQYLIDMSLITITWQSFVR